MDTHDEFVELAASLTAAAAAYYAGDGTQLMDDATYDAGIRALAAARAAHPEWSEADGLLTQVAAGVGGGDVPHATPMLSLDNAMDDDEMGAFFSRVSKLTGVHEDDLPWAIDPKLDGMALSLVYEHGTLARIVTRGSGTAGEDVTAIARHAVGIPASIVTTQAILEVRGECVMTHEDFAVANQLRTAEGKAPFANPRNAVAGSIRAIHRAYQVPFHFLAYAVADDPRAIDSAAHFSHSGQMDFLDARGFTTARTILTGAWKVTGTDEVLAAISQIELARASFPMDTDGAVIKLDDPDLAARAGNGTRAPRWAIARKFAPDTRETDLLDIVIAVGRTGNLSFTAALTPVAVGGATVSSATVHNPSMIAAKGLRLPTGPGSTPQRVIVRRAGEVIPEVVGPADVNDDSTTTPFTPPTSCPRCGSALDTTGLVWRCEKGRDCATEAGIRYAVSRDCLDIEGMGDQIVDALVTSGTVATVADLFTLTLEDLLGVDRLGEKNATKILTNITAARALPMNKVFCSLGVALTGRSMSRRLARHFGTMAALRAASLEQLEEVEGVGPERAASIRAELDRLAEVFDALEQMGIGQSEPASAPAPGAEESTARPLAGKKVVVSGSVPGLSRNEANEAVERLGGTSSGSISKNTDLLVAGEGAGSKLAKAESLGIAVMAADEFAALVAATG